MLGVFFSTILEMNVSTKSTLKKFLPLYYCHNFMCSHYCPHSLSFIIIPQFALNLIWSLRLVSDQAKANAYYLLRSLLLPTAFLFLAATYGSQLRILKGHIKNSPKTEYWWFRLLKIKKKHSELVYCNDVYKILWTNILFGRFFFSHLC